MCVNTTSANPMDRVTLGHISAHLGWFDVEAGVLSEISLGRTWKVTGKYTWGT